MLWKTIFWQRVILWVSIAENSDKMMSQLPSMSEEFREAQYIGCGNEKVSGDYKTCTANFLSPLLLSF
jgi:hypothetical protein